MSTPITTNVAAVIGKRVYPDKLGNLWLGPGEYGKNIRGTWDGRPPGSYAVTLQPFGIEEHTDGTISTSRQIQVRQAYKCYDWCGSLQHGAWLKEE